MKCQYCGNNAKRVTGKDIFPHRKKIWKEKFFQCKPCDAHVRCHWTHGNKYKTFGELANRRLRWLRNQAHIAFDPIWKNEHMTRKDAYEWLAGKLGLCRERAHIGMFSVEQCQKAIDICAEFFL